MEKFNLSDISEALTLQVLDDCFKLKTKSQDNVVRFQITRAGPAGEGLLGAVYRIIVSANQYSTSFIVKGLVRDLLLRKTLGCEVFFAREISFYSTILPALMHVQTSLGAKENIQKYVPICYYSFCDGKNFILEDLSELGCTSISEPTEFQKEGILKAIAHLHAVSIAMRLNNPEQFFKLANKFPESYYRKDRKNWYCKYLITALELDKAVIKEFEDINSIYYKKFLDVLNDDIYQQMIDVCSTLGDHVVLNHGDSWCPNFMSTKERVIAFDFQLFRFASPATDLSFFLFCNIDRNSPKEDFLKKVDLYYYYLSYFLNDMSLDVNKIFPRYALDDEIRKFGKFGFLAALSTIPLSDSKKCDVMTTFEENFHDYEIIPLENLWKLTSIKSREHKDSLVNTLHVAVDLGII